jgi:hypothetical protein
MTAGYIVGSLVGSFAIAYLCDTFVSDKKAFGGQCHYIYTLSILKYLSLLTFTPTLTIRLIQKIKVIKKLNIFLNYIM